MLEVWGDMFHWLRLPSQSLGRAEPQNNPHCLVLAINDQAVQPLLQCKPDKVLAQMTNDAEIQCIEGSQDVLSTTIIEELCKANIDIAEFSVARCAHRVAIGFGKESKWTAKLALAYSVAMDGFAYRIKHADFPREARLLYESAKAARKALESKALSVKHVITSKAWKEQGEEQEASHKKRLRCSHPSPANGENAEVMISSDDEAFAPRAARPPLSNSRTQPILARREFRLRPSLNVSKLARTPMTCETTVLVNHCAQSCDEEYSSRQLPSETEECPWRKKRKSAGQITDAIMPRMVGKRKLARQDGNPGRTSTASTDRHTVPFKRSQTRQSAAERPGSVSQREAVTPPPRARRRQSVLASSGLRLCPKQPLTPPPPYMRRAAAAAKRLGVSPKELLDPASSDLLTSMPAGWSVEIVTHGEETPLEGIDFDWDMRSFRDPDKHLINIRKHDGHHPVIIKRMIAHHLFNDWLREVRHTLSPLQTLSSRYPSRLRISLWCRRGRHRSVAAAIMLSYVLEKALCCLVTVKHLSLQRCGCAECSGGLSPAAKGRLWQAWKSSSY